MTNTSISSAKRSMLVVEDEALLRMVAINLFEDAGFDVVSAETADQAASILADTDHIDGLFTDIEMPGSLNGLSLAQLAHRIHPEAAILVVSGRTQPKQTDLPPRSRFIGKPYRSATVMSAFNDMWEN